MMVKIYTNEVSPHIYAIYKTLNLKKLTGTVLKQTLKKEKRIK